MNIKKVLAYQIAELKPSSEEIKRINRKVMEFMEDLKQELKKDGHGEDVFIGGSFAKGTLIKKDKYDVDIFVRFPWQYDDISNLLERPLKSLVKKKKLKLEKLHGSRDYFRVNFQEFYFEVIPVTKIKKPREEKNVTDLTYFHVPYIKRKIGKLHDDIILAKAFCHTQKAYGAETYVRGFSGYSIELLVIYYKGFIKMLRALSKVKKGDRIVIDLGKKYRKKDEVFFDMNEAKLQSPIILVDPTYKERNALAALGRETFERFQEAAGKFLRNPGKKYFEEEKIDAGKLESLAKKRKAEFLHVKVSTDRQAGDIAGTKLKKFHYFVESETKKYFDLLKHEFEYDEKQSADFYLVAKSKKEILQVGPPMYTKKLRKHIKAFKSAHKNTFARKNVLYAKIKIDFTLADFVRKIGKDKDLLKEMGISELKIN